MDPALCSRPGYLDISLDFVQGSDPNLRPRVFDEVAFFIHHQPLSHYRFEVISNLFQGYRIAWGQIWQLWQLFYIFITFYFSVLNSYSACMCPPNCGSMVAANTLVKIVPSRLAPYLLG